MGEDYEKVLIPYFSSCELLSLLLRICRILHLDRWRGK